MSVFQWQFQYDVIQERKKKKSAEDLMNSIILLNRLSGEIDSLSVLINPKKAQEYMKIQYERRDKERKKIMEDLYCLEREEEKKETTDKNLNNIDIKNEKEIEEYMNTFYKDAPDTFEIPDEVNNRKNFVAPKFNRKERLARKKRFMPPITSDQSVKECSLKDIEQQMKNEETIVLKKK